MNVRLFALALVLALAVDPAASAITRYFTSSYHDVHMTMRRFGYCVGDLAPLKSAQFNETSLLINQIKVFLDQGTYEQEQLMNVSRLMDSICRKDTSSDYPISVHLDVDKYTNETGKYYRCRAIDETFEPMYYAFREAAMNHSAPLDFSSIVYSPSYANKTNTYNLTDLINTSWIRADYELEAVCKITDSIKDIVSAKINKDLLQRREQQDPSSSSSTYWKNIMAWLDRLLDPILGIQKRLIWEGNNMAGRVYSTVGGGLKGVRKSVTSIWSSPSRSAVNSTKLMAVNGTASASGSSIQTVAVNTPAMLAAPVL